jgi:MFS family permease
VVARRVSLDADEYPALTAIGMSRRQLFATTMTRVALIAATGSVLAVVGAVLASPLLPIGPARLAEPSRGFAFNWAILGLGGLAILALVVALAAIPAWRATRAAVSQSRRAGHEPKSRLAESLASAGFPAPSVIGVRNALQPGQGKTRVPVRSAIIVSGVAIALVVAAFAFTTNLDRLANTPKLYGWDWTFKAGVGKYGLDPAATMSRVRADADVEAVGLGNFGSVRVGGRDTPAVGIDRKVGSVFPTLLEGRAPETGDEIVLGTRTLRRANADVGDTIEVSNISIRTGCEDCQPETRPMRIVGRAVFPKLGLESYNPTNLGDGAATIAGVFAPPDVPEELYTLMLIRLRPGADVAAARERLNRFLAPQGFCLSEPDCVRPAERPGDISNYDRVRGTSLALAVALGVIALGLLVHVLVSSVRRRRRDLAVLKTLGFSRRQVSSVSAWQASTIAVLALLIGVPLGVILGSVLWRVFADQLGVAPDVSLPVVSLVVAVPATILLANLIAAVPALLAARTHPATVLRSE